MDLRGASHHPYVCSHHPPGLAGGVILCVSTQPNIHLTSTTEAVETVIIRRPVRAKGAGERSELLRPLTPRGWRGLARKDWRKGVWMELRYSHSTGDPHVVVRARGREWSYSWDVSVLDILRDVCNRSSG
jgi:hypothetical protein